jgi:hypothetical protein
MPSGASPAKEMEAYTFTDGTVKQTLAGFVLLQADVTHQVAARQGANVKIQPDWPARHPVF